MVAIAGFGLAASAPEASAAEPTPVCGAGTCTVTYGPGTGQTFVVPTGVVSLTVAVYGAAGGGSETAIGGDGAMVQATLVAPLLGTPLTVDVGAGGLTFSDGKAAVGGGGVNAYGTGGGGASDIEAGGVPVLVAGGGGGAGNTDLDYDCSQEVPPGLAGGRGGDAGQPGQAGDQLSPSPGLVLTAGGGGGAGSSTGPGQGGSAGVVQGSATCAARTYAGEPGAPGTATSGNTTTGALAPLDAGYGGGGGGGYPGGGQGGAGAAYVGQDGPTSDQKGGASGGGGGGGASYVSTSAAVVDPSVDDQGTPSGPMRSAGAAGEVVISYVDPLSLQPPASTPEAPLAVALPAAAAVLGGATLVGRRRRGGHGGAVRNRAWRFPRAG